MKSAKAIIILCFYAASIFGYCVISFLHSLAHQIDNPFHRHKVEQSHHHYFEDHGASKFLAQVQAESDYLQAIKIVSVLYFFSFYTPAVAINHQPIFDWLKKLFVTSISIFEMDFSPPSPPPDAVLMFA